MKLVALKMAPADTDLIVNADHVVYVQAVAKREDVCRVGLVDVGGEHASVFVVIGSAMEVCGKLEA